MKTIVLADFSKTFTTPACPTTWSVFAKSGLLGKEYTADRNKLYAEYIHFEDEGNVFKTQEWFHAHADLFVKYQLSKALIDEVVTTDIFFEPREGIAEFLAYIRKENIPLKIVTSGITNFVEAFFEERGFGCEGIEIYGNTLIVDGDGKVVWVDRSKGIVPMAKNMHTFSVEDYDRILVIGDNKEDLSVYEWKNRKSFGFIEGGQGFDVSLGKEGKFTEILQILSNM